MRIDELTVEVRDGDLNRVGQLLGADIVGAQFILRHNNVGSWSVKLPATSPMADLLRTPGYGLVVTGRDTVLLSGPTVSAKLLQSQEDLQGVWQIEGADDSLILQERLAYPSPAVADVSAQVATHDVQSGVAETVLKHYVDANLVSGPAERVVDGLTVATDSSRGTTVDAQARFANIQELLYGIAQSGGLGYTVTQVDAGLVFDVYEPVDVSANVRLDVDNGRLSSSEYAYSAPKLTRAIVGGAGEAIERLFAEGTTVDSLASETVWKRRIEAFVDERGSEDADQLSQAGLEALVDDGKTRVSMAVTPSDSETMLFGADWNLGDTVTVVVNDLEATAVVYEVGVAVQSDGVYIAATVGNPTPLEFESKLVATQNNHADRISNLERNTTGYGISTIFAVSGGTDGTQPTFDGPVFSGKYTRFGNMVHFAYQVDFDNILTFGTGQYYMTLPYPSANDYVLRDGCLHQNSTGRQYHISGSVDAGETDLWLFTTDRQGNRIYDFPFEQGEPITLTTADNFHIAGTYEIEV